MQVILVSILAFLLGVVLLLYGHRVIHTLRPIWGFAAGFWLGANVAGLIFGDGFLGNLTGWIAGLVLGVVLASLSHFFHELYVGLLGAVIGYMIGSGLLTALGLAPGLLSALGGLVLALIVAALFYRLDVKTIIAMASSSAAGANAVLLAILLPIGQVSLTNLQSTGNPIEPVLRSSWVWPVVWLALVVVGYLIQAQARQTARLDHR